MIYKLRFDRSKYLTFEISPDELEEKFGEDYLFMLDKPCWDDFWKPLNVKFLDFSDNKKVTTPPDVTCWFTDQIVLNEKAYSLLSEALANYGELLPVLCEGIPYWILHVTEKTGNDAIDDVKSKRSIEEGGYIEISKITFKDEAINHLLIFKSEFDGFRDIYCTDEFKDLLESHNLKGLVFNSNLASVF